MSVLSDRQTRLVNASSLRDLYRAMIETSAEIERGNVVTGEQMDNDTDWSELPTFGPEYVGDDRNGPVWSWDATHMIRGACANELKIVSRD